MFIGDNYIYIIENYKINPEGNIINYKFKHENSTYNE